MNVQASVRGGAQRGVYRSEGLQRGLVDHLCHPVVQRRCDCRLGLRARRTGTGEKEAARDLNSADVVDTRSCEDRDARCFPAMRREMHWLPPVGPDYRCVTPRSEQDLKTVRITPSGGEA